MKNFHSKRLKEEKRKLKKLKIFGSVDSCIHEICRRHTISYTLHKYYWRKYVITNA